MEKLPAMLLAMDDVNLKAVAAQLTISVASAKVATEWIATMFPNNPAAVFAGAVHYLKLMGTVAGGWMMARAALAAATQMKAGVGDVDYLRAKVMTTRFYADHILTMAPSFADALIQGAESVLQMEEALF